MWTLTVYYNDYSRGNGGQEKFREFLGYPSEGSAVSRGQEMFRAGLFIYDENEELLALIPPSQLLWLEIQKTS
jgi:hypothetical protein